MTFINMEAGLCFACSGYFLIWGRMDGGMAFIIIIGLLNRCIHYYRYLFIHCGDIAFITLEAFILDEWHFINMEAWHLLLLLDCLILDIITSTYLFIVEALHLLLWRHCIY
jgi:hypothetical protein